MQRTFEEIVEEHASLFKKWTILSQSLRGVKMLAEKSVIEEMQVLSQQMQVLRGEMDPVRPTILLSWLDVLPYLPVIDSEGNTITHASLSKAKKYSYNNEEHILFHYLRENGTKFIRHEPNKLNVLANTWAVYVPRSEAERIGITRYFQNKDMYHGDERPAARDSVQIIIYKENEEGIEMTKNAANFKAEDEKPEVNETSRKIQFLLNSYYDDGRLDPIILNVNGKEYIIFKDDEDLSSENTSILRTLPVNYDFDKNGYPDDSIFEDIEFDPHDQEILDILQQIITWV